MAIEWPQDWKKAKTFFETETGKKKPDTKVLSIFSRHQTGLDSQIGKIDAAYKVAKATPNTKNIAEYRKLVVAFKKSKDDYIKVLDTTVDKEIRDQATKTVYSKACRFLAKQLDAIYGSMDGQINWLVSAQQQQSAADATAANALKSIEGAIAKCAAAIAKVKTKPTPDTFRTEIYTPARDLSQFIGNIAILRKKGYNFPAKITDDKARTIYQIVRPYGDGNPAALMPDGTETDMVLLELKKLTSGVKAAAELIKA